MREPLLAGVLIAACASGAALAAAVHPDLTGIYWSEGGFRGPSSQPGGPQDPNGPGKIVEGPPPMKGAYAADYALRQTSRVAGTPVGDPGAGCYIGGFPRNMSVPYPIEIIQTPRTITWLWEGGDRVRRVHMDRKTHDDQLKPQFSGDSIGRWEGPVLVIDTVNYRSETVLDGNGTPHSGALHTIERVSLAPGSRNLIDEVSVEDDKALSRPWLMKYLLKNDPKTKMMEWSCEENNRNPLDENGVTRTTKQGGQ
jgi:hypothetical protein